MNYRSIFFFLSILTLQHNACHELKEYLVDVNVKKTNSLSFDKKKLSKIKKASISHNKYKFLKPPLLKQLDINSSDFDKESFTLKLYDGTGIMCVFYPKTNTYMVYQKTEDEMLLSTNQEENKKLFNKLKKRRK